jgi:hypothetical protein
MSPQQTLELVRLHHVFWENELRRAPDGEREDCEFFHEQVKDEIVALEHELELARTYRASLPVPHPQLDARFSTSWPPTRKVRTQSLGS